MRPAKIRVNTKGFRAINSADLLIDGITVVAGENGCGKSSISKLLYFLYKTVSGYDILVHDNLKRGLTDIVRYTEILEQELFFSIRDSKARNDFRKDLHNLRNDSYRGHRGDLNKSLQSWLDFITKLEDLYKDAVDFNKVNALTPNRLNRLQFILSDILKIPESEIKFENSFNLIRNTIINKFKKAEGITVSRPISVFKEELKTAFSDGVLPEKFEVKEYDDTIVALDMNHVAIPYNIQSSFYIDTPMMLSVYSSFHQHWNDLNNSLSKKGNFRDELTELISSQILHGDIDTEDGFSPEDFVYTRDDGETFNLMDVATGIKAISIIQMLLKNGSLNDKTLLIIDEPESHLHPQWIIEYARIIVLLNKKLGVKFFIATHNPDMVSAIRYISQKEEILDQVNFYLAERIGVKYSYDYRYLGNDIDPIFESFNIALDRIHQYGV